MSDEAGAIDSMDVDMEKIKELPIDRIKTLYSFVNEDELPLPRRLNRHTTHCFINLTDSKLSAVYGGGSRTPLETCLARTKNRIPLECGSFYFEVTILSTNDKIDMGIGVMGSFMPAKPTFRFRVDSQAFYALQGHGYKMKIKSRRINFEFKNGDVIGVLINFSKLCCQFICNGVELQEVVENLPPYLYPAIGFMREGDSATINFGQIPFVYKQYEILIKDLRETALKKVIEFDLNAVLSVNHHQILNKMVLSYLSHHAYADTAKAFADATNQKLKEPLPSISKRKEILNMVRGLKFAEAIASLQVNFPECLQKNKKLKWKLKLQQFVATLKNALALDTESKDREIVQLIQFGRDIDTLFQALNLEGLITDMDRKNQENVFALLIYDPPNMAMAGWDLPPIEMESLCGDITSALMVSLDGRRRSEIEYYIANAGEKMRLLRMIADADMCRIGLEDVFDF